MATRGCFDLRGVDYETPSEDFLRLLCKHCALVAEQLGAETSRFGWICGFQAQRHEHHGPLFGPRKMINSERTALLFERDPLVAFWVPLKQNRWEMISWHQSN